MTKIVAPGAQVREYTGEDGHRYREHVFTESASLVVEDRGVVWVEVRGGGPRVARVQLNTGPNRAARRAAASNRKGGAA